MPKMPKMITNCERCGDEIEDDEVEKCEVCGQDGLCNDCLMDHRCVPTRPIPTTPE